MRSLSPIEAVLTRLVGSVTSLTGRGGRSLLILIYHRVLPAPDALRGSTVDAARFSAQMDLIASCFNPLPLPEALERLRARSLPPRPVSVTFDDGYADNLTVALPIMRRRGIRPTVFVASAYLDGGLMFNDGISLAVRHAPARFDLADLGLGVLNLADPQARRQAIGHLVHTLKYRLPDDRRSLVREVLARSGAEVPRDLMLTTAQLRALRAAGADIGAHTATHPILTRLEPAAALADIADGRAALEAVLQEPVRLFAYPNGRPGDDYDAQHVEMVRKLGFAAAVSTSWGAAHQGSDPFQVPRVAPWDRSAIRYAGRLVSSYLDRTK